jgi:Clp amino terminal domain, pathogenicity island component
MEDAVHHLDTAIRRARELTDTADALIGRAVADARAAGLSWTEIGHAFGTSKQAVQQRYGSSPPGRWADDARHAIDQAGAEAAMLGHGHIGTEHVLLALASTSVLAELGVTRERVLATSCMQQPPSDARGPLPLMPRLKQALEGGVRIADDLGAAAAGSEHLLAGIVAVDDSMAVEILRRLGVRPRDVRGALARRLGVEPRQLGGPRRRRRRLLV